MAQNRVKAGDVVDLLLSGSTWSGAKTTALVKTDAFEAIRMVVPAGREIARHEVPGK